VDTLVVNFVLLAGTKSLGFILTIARNSYILKVVLAIGLTPLIYAGHALLRRHFHLSEVTTRDVVIGET
jgi:uncharacterized PurR-regulated membrane protein YhhQ (DUF165 family)